MKKLKELEEAEQILTELDVQDLIEPAISLPIEQEKMQPLYGKKYVLVNYQTGFIPSKTYMCVFEDGQFVWKLINYTEEGLLDAPTNVWAKSTRDVTTGRATVYIHWDDPEDKEDVHWQYSVIVKKKGSEPSSIYDGQIAGYSSIRDQYAGKTGFVDSVDIDTVDDRDILDGTIIQTKDEDRYWYKIFAVTRYGKSTGSDAFLGELTWAKLQELIRAGVAHYAIEIGDIVQVKHNSIGVIPFQVVAFDNANAMDKDGNALEHSITFMSYDVLFRGSFDHKEELFAETTDTVWQSKQYYEYNENTHLWVVIDKSSYESPVAYFNTHNKWPNERNPCWIDPNQQGGSESNASLYGRNWWVHSNARMWLNSEEKTSSWYKKELTHHIWETYGSNFNQDGSYGFGELAFTGFKKGLEEELQQVMAISKVVTTKPMWLRTPEQLRDGINPVEESHDYVFLPSYAELYGVQDDTYPSDVFRDVGENVGEGKQFDIYSKQIAETYAKHITTAYNTTTTSVPSDPDNHLASWYMRTPTRSLFHDPGLGSTHKTSYLIDCVEAVTAENVQYDNMGGLRAIPGAPYRAYNPAKSGSPLDEKSDAPRDVRNNKFTPTGTTKQYTANTTPGFAPCFVVG